MESCKEINIMSINSDIPNKETDLHPITSHKVEELSRVIASKLKPWREMHIQRRLNVMNYSGKVISYTGVTLEGSPMLVLWDNFIEPFLKNGAVGIIKDTYLLCVEKGLLPQDYMKEAGGLLKLLNKKTYEGMGELCSKARNMGFPNGVTPVNVEERINAMNLFVDSYATAIMKKGISIFPSLSNDEEKGLQMVVPFPEKGIDWNNVKWEDVKMIIRVESKEIDISINGSKQRNYHYSQMGFKQQCIDKPTKAWHIFLCFAIADNNILSLNTLKRFRVNMKLQAFQDRISEIRTNLKSFFPNLTDDPIPHTIKVGYKPKFSIFVIPDPTDSNEFSK
jgi:hypothetical protein